MKTGKIRKTGKNRKPKKKMGNQGKGQETKENAGNLGEEETNFRLYPPLTSPQAEVPHTQPLHRWAGSWEPVGNWSIYSWVSGDHGRWQFCTQQPVY